MGVYNSAEGPSTDQRGRGRIVLDRKSDFMYIIDMTFTQSGDILWRNEACTPNLIPKHTIRNGKLESTKVYRIKNMNLT